MAQPTGALATMMANYEYDPAAAEKDAEKKSVDVAETGLVKWQTLNPISRPQSLVLVTVSIYLLVMTVVAASGNILLVLWSRHAGELRR
ncbi:hypothetical protein DFJ77DRAFT_511298 [Powellomyces hirtus]|nr:hypothetical protein DFJ77DRAFT_511298 [Powellomyces hirtus]